MTAPATEPGFLIKRRKASAHRERVLVPLKSVTATFDGDCGDALVLLIAYPRIQPRIGEIDQDVGHHDGNGDDQR